jgi:hypothetical protein
MLANAAGRWHGTNKLQDPHSGKEDETQSTATMTAESDRTFRLEYTWSYHGKPQSGSLRIKVESDGVTASLTDTWHTGNQPMAFTGLPPNSATVSIRGTYPAPPGPDWGWRIDLTPEKERLRMVMWNIWPAPWQISALACSGEGTRDSVGVGPDACFKSRRPFETIAEFCRTHEIPFCDVSGSFTQDPQPERLYLKNAAVFSAAGHALYGSQLAEFLLRQVPGLEPGSLDYIKPAPQAQMSPRFK